MESAKYAAGEEKLGSSNLLKWSNIIAFVLVVIVNGLAGSTTLIGGKFTAEVSNANPTLITPAGYTFAIWGIIYILLGVFVIYQALPQSRNKKFHEKVGWLFVLSSAFNIIWLFTWQYELLPASVVIMFLLLATLIIIYLRLDIGRGKVDLVERVAVHLPFSVYLGWITIASIADVAATLVSVGWDGFGISAESWAILIILIALLIASLVAYTRRDVAYELVIVWAFLGIVASQNSNQTIDTLLMVSVAVLLIVLVASFFLGRRGSRRLAIG